MDIDALKNDYLSGMNIFDITRKYKISKSTFYNFKAKYIFMGKRNTKYIRSVDYPFQNKTLHIQVVIEEYVNGSTMEQIANRYHISPYIIKEELIRHDVQIRSNYIDLTGKKIGRLLVIERTRIERTKKYYICRCECGKEKIIKQEDLMSGLKKDCGCISAKPRSKHIGEITRTHGDSKTRLYHIWHGMKRRCNAKTCKAYKNYGGRGIKMYDEWNSDYTSFKNWALAHGYKDNLTIERLDVNGNYSPDNCTWITKHDQGLNKRNTKYLTLYGESKPAAEWCRILNIKPSTLHSWVVRNGNVKDISKYYEFLKQKKRI